MRCTDSANPAAANIKIVICIYGINEQGLTCGEAKEIFLNLLSLNIIYYLIVTAEWFVINVTRQSLLKKNEYIMSTDFEYVSNLYDMRTRKANEFP